VPTRSPLTLPSPRLAGRGDLHARRHSGKRLEAAHIKWFQARGPDVVQNGLALCSLHHKIFDPGAFTVLPENHQIVFSRHLMGGDDTKAELLAHHGAGLIQPQGRECLPQPEFLAWHRAEVFKEPARE